MSHATVLVIDDEKDLLELVRYNLEKEHLDVITANDGQSGLEIGLKHKPDLVLLDLMMPEMDGFEFLVEMRSHTEWRDIPVLVVTAKDLTAEERTRLNGDVERVLQKGSSELDELLREIGRVLPGSIERRRAAKTVEGTA